jgi:hypothetical protein
MLRRVLLASVFTIATVGALATFESVASAAPNPGLAQVTSDGSSPIIQVDRRCGPRRHYIGRHRVRGRDGRLHWVAGRCVRNR